jgi:hypothetical protein
MRGSFLRQIASWMPAGILPDRRSRATCYPEPALPQSDPPACAAGGGCRSGKWSEFAAPLEQAGYASLGDLHPTLARGGVDLRYARRARWRSMPITATTSGPDPCCGRAGGDVGSHPARSGGYATAVVLNLEGYQVASVLMPQVVGGLGPGESAVPAVIPASAPGGSMVSPSGASSVSQSPSCLDARCLPFLRRCGARNEHRRRCSRRGSSPRRDNRQTAAATDTAHQSDCFSGGCPATRPRVPPSVHHQRRIAPR